MQDFYDISGQRINVAKCKLYVPRNINQAVELAISSKWGIPLTSHLGKYLSCWLFMAKSPNEHPKKWALKFRRY